LTASANTNNNSSSSVTTDTKDPLAADVLKDKKLNELERTVNALLRKMTEVLFIMLSARMYVAIF
jgi:hypothetical protein